MLDTYEEIMMHGVRTTQAVDSMTGGMTLLRVLLLPNCGLRCMDRDIVQYEMWKALRLRNSRFKYIGMELIECSNDCKTKRIISEESLLRHAMSS